MMSIDDTRVSERLAQFMARARWEDIPDAVRHEAKRSLMNFFACALGGCRDEAVTSSASVLKRFGADASSTVIGRGERTDALNAAFLNAAAANVFDFDDTHTRSIIHPSAPVSGALFALAELSGMSGPRLLLSFVLGLEAECRIGNAISPGHYRRGWHITSTCGVFGAAAAAASALALPPQQVTWALGNASAQAGGLLETLGTMAKSVSVGNAARNGLVSALFAEAGVFGPERPLEGLYGFLRVMGENPDVECVTERLGETWEISANSYKPYPCGIVLNPVIEACLELSRDLQGTPERLERVEITAHPLLRERTDRVHPRTSREAQVSAQHAVAVALARGRAGLSEFSDESTRDASLRALREKVSLVDDASYAVESASVTVHLAGEKPCSRRIDQAYGSSARPLSDSALEQKVKDLVEHGGSRCDPQPLIEAVWSLERAEDAGAVVKLAAGAR
jgi:2-methylcitrate dehydratase PrpD